MNPIIRQMAFYAGLIVLFTACETQDDWLNAKRNKNDVLPHTVGDYQALMDNNLIMNRNYPMLAMVCTDNLFLEQQQLNTLTTGERNSYRFAKDIFEGESPGVFFNPYIKIEYANIVLEGLQEITPVQPENKHVRGQALFLRAFTFYYLAQTFCKQYDPATAATDMGIQLRLTADPNVSTSRASVENTYERILLDLKEASDILPVTPLYGTRPSKIAAYALLAKVYLNMGDYQQARSYADKALEGGHTLLDFNSSQIDSSSTFIFPEYINGSAANPEIIFYASNQSYSSLWPVYGVQYVDSLLYRSYHINDLRRKLFFKEDGHDQARFIGGYTGTFYAFGGIALNELYLILAECKARAGQWEEGMKDLNTLLVHRFGAGTFKALLARNQGHALALILEERRKELPFTGQIRWEDLRRLNKDPQFAKTVVHYENGVSHELSPGDNRYVFPFPDSEIQLSGIKQNPR